jgi:hypothetical protein
MRGGNHAGSAAAYGSTYEGCWALPKRTPRPAHPPQICNPNLQSASEDSSSGSCSRGTYMYAARERSGALRSSNTSLSCCLSGAEHPPKLSAARARAAEPPPPSRSCCWSSCCLDGRTPSARLLDSMAILRRQLSVRESMASNAAGLWRPRVTAQHCAPEIEVHIHQRRAQHRHAIGSFHSSHTIVSFHSSHTIVSFHPSHTLDPTYVRSFLTISSVSDEHGVSVGGGSCMVILPGEELVAH